MDCTTAQASLSPLIDDALASAQADEVRGHLRFCQSCARAHDALRELSRRVRELGATALPAGFRARLDERRAGAASPPPAQAPGWMKLAPALAAAFVIVVFGLTQRRPTAQDRADDELRTAMKRAPELAPPEPAAGPRLKTPAPEYTNESQAEFLNAQRDMLGIQSVGSARVAEDMPNGSLIGGGSITDPKNKPQVEAAMRRMAALSRSIRERSEPPEVPIAGHTAPVLAKRQEDAGGSELSAAAPEAGWEGKHAPSLEGTRTIYSEKEWRAVWGALSPEPVPAVDFAIQQVVAVFLGRKPTGGYAAEIAGVVPTQTALIVQWIERAPEPGVPGADGVTSPFAMRVVPRTDLPVRYQKLAP